jgi:hypothetical protein
MPVLKVPEVSLLQETTAAGKCGDCVIRDDACAVKFFSIAAIRNALCPRAARLEVFYKIFRHRFQTPAYFRLRFLIRFMVVVGAESEEADEDQQSNGRRPEAFSQFLFVNVADGLGGGAIGGEGERLFKKVPWKTPGTAWPHA